MLKLPPGITACLFDLDGVLTQTAKLHAAAWKEMFDEFLRERAEETGEELVPFDSTDYDKYVDGRPRTQRCSRTRWPGSRPGGPATSVGSSGWTGPARRTRCPSTAPTSW